MGAIRRLQSEAVATGAVLAVGKLALGPFDPSRLLRPGSLDSPDRIFPTLAFDLLQQATWSFSNELKVEISN